LRLVAVRSDEGTITGMKVRHPGQVGVPSWWRLFAWPSTALGVLLVAAGAASAVLQDMLGLQLALIGLLMVVLSWANAIALGPRGLAG